MANIKIKDIYEQNKNDVYSYILSLTHNKSLSEDLTSEVFLGAIKGLARFKGESTIKTWLFSIARYKWYEYLRKTKKEIEQKDFLEIYFLKDISMEKDVLTNELINKIYDILDKEPEKNKSIVLMRINGYSYFEIANKHNISESSARVIDFRTKGKIRNKLLKEGYVNEFDFM